ncbi:hypothetical protein WG926_07255 [Tistrella sp. BH-R2-4]|uniref:AB hydrolase-1 domain-containing protein n=1 Tax=Tistrella arctica TaxID=3133430 RepID=A0ABU9YH24_9PROT
MMGMLNVLKIGAVDLVAHDIGGMITRASHAFAARDRDQIRRAVLMTPPIGPVLTIRSWISDLCRKTSPGSAWPSTHGATRSPATRWT